MNFTGKITALISSALLFACGGSAENIKSGDLAPGFSLKDDKGITYNLSDYTGKSPVVLYFYPKAGTPGCTKQACGIRDIYQEFNENNISVFGISVDSENSLKEFRKEENLNFPLLSDNDKKVSESYGVLNNLGFSSRITFIIDKSGRIANIIRDVDVSTHAADVLELAKKLK
ncbi:MAG: peroxiredoxin [Ignavibacteriales bacterium]|nr:peroxiredoxin [Ignavibacteriales bacterium]MCF8314523.1 peroxiredoxin [Ignavibacteriales bacterium]MCF8436440.1 peroxiredoxin [Ignavibacteriales bacterium]